VPTHERLGPDDCENLQDRRKPAIQLDKEPAIIVREPDATRQPTPHDIQLMSKHRVLSFKPQLRLEWLGHDGQSETEQPDHSASLGHHVINSNKVFGTHNAVKALEEMGATLIDCVKRAENMAAGCKDAIAYVQDTAQKYREEAKLIFDRIEQASVMTAEVKSVCDEMRKKIEHPAQLADLRDSP
jgi:hypothetical protein